MSQRRFSLFDLFLFVAFCSLVLALVVPLMRRGDGIANEVKGLAFSADGSTIAALFGDGKIRGTVVLSRQCQRCPNLMPRLSAAFDFGRSAKNNRLKIAVNFGATLRCSALAFCRGPLRAI